MCGSGNSNWEEKRVTVTCQAATVHGKLAVRVWTSLNQAAGDETFGIDNVIATKIFTPETNKFAGTDFQGWNCGNITKCGKFGNLCGGFGAKGHGSDIKKTFTVPAGTYNVKLDFVKIDSWYVRVGSVVH